MHDAPKQVSHSLHIALTQSRNSPPSCPLAPSAVSRNHPAGSLRRLLAFLLPKPAPETSAPLSKMPGLVLSQASSSTGATFSPDKPTGKTFSNQGRLPKLPIPPLEDTCRRYLQALEALQDPEEHEATSAAVRDFLENEGPGIQRKLIEWAKNKDRYVKFADTALDGHSCDSATSRSFGTSHTSSTMTPLSSPLTPSSFLSKLRGS